MKIGAVIQARISSTRLPGKVLKELPYGSKITVLEQVLRRVRKSRNISKIIIATTAEKEDDELVKVAQKEGVAHFRGSKEDVLSRYYFASKEYKLDIIVRITSDCPCIDPKVVDLVIEKHIAAKADFTSNILKRTFPHGLDTEVLNFDALEKAHLNSKDSFEREHVCPYIYNSNPKAFRISSVEAPEHLHAPDVRVTLDTEQDYALLCSVFDYQYSEKAYFGVEDIIKLFNNKPWLKLINKNVIHKKIFNSLQAELKEGVKILGFQELHRAKELLAKHII